MPLNKINISSNTKVEFDDMYLNELLSLYGIKHGIYTSDIMVTTSSSVNLPFTKLAELKKVVDEKLFSKDFGNLSIQSNSTLYTSVQKINSMLEVMTSNNKVNYFKRIELVSADDKEITFNLLSKIGLTIPLVIELPITLERFLILNFKIKNGVATFLKLINSILKFSSNKTIIDNNNIIRLDLREIIDLPKSLLLVIDNWMSKLNGNIYFDEKLIKLDLSFKVDKTPFEELDINTFL